jgi:hypothetical protein
LSFLNTFIIFFPERDREAATVDILFFCGSREAWAAPEITGVLLLWLAQLLLIQWRVGGAGAGAVE